MKATIIGWNEYANEKFNYTIENVVGVMQFLDTITINHIYKEEIKVSSYNIHNVKIIVEN